MWRCSNAWPSFIEAAAAADGRTKEERPVGLGVGLLFYFGAAFAAALAYHLGYRRRPAAEAAHVSAVFGLAVVAVVFMIAVVQGLVFGEPTAGA